MLTKRLKLLRREQLDRMLLQSGILKNIVQPKRGWIRETREVLGLSAQQLADRIGISQPTVAKMEQAEARGSVTIQTLKRTADAMGCQLVYLFVPRTSFEEILQTRATEVATRLLARVEHTMALEAQSADGEFRARRVQELADELVRTLSRDLWEEENSTPKNTMKKAPSGKDITE